MGFYAHAFVLNENSVTVLILYKLGGSHGRVNEGFKENPQMYRGK